MECSSKGDLTLDGSSLSSASEDDETSITGDSELMQKSMNIIDIIDCLLRLSVSIQNPAPHNRFQETISTNTSFYEVTNIKYICNKFELAEEWLIERLGKTIFYRKHYFKYRDVYH